jgi:molybdenum cofactor cytidylyltransferase
MQLINALRYSQPSSLAFVGAGGKTTAIFKTARELLAASMSKPARETVLVTTTTHFGVWQSVYADHLYKLNSLADFKIIEKDLLKGVVLLTGDEQNNLLVGLPRRLVDKVHVFAEEHFLPLLIEADGSHTCPLKAPASHEPAIPDFTQVVVVVAGLQGLGQPLTKTWVHRPEKFAELSGLHIGELISRSALVKVLLSTEGGLKNIPSKADRVVLLNQADTPELQASGKAMAEKLISKYQSIIIASLSRGDAGSTPSEAFSSGQGNEIHAVFEQIGGIILAAGGSSRFGKSKQMLIWKGIPLVRHVAITALKAGLSPVVLVTGASAEEIESVIKDLPVRIVNNHEWAMGMSSSIKTGVTSLPKGIGGAVFLQADQPQIPATLIQGLVEAHERTLNPIIAPQIDGQRGNPVLFDASTFTELQSLEGDIGGRALFEKFPIQWFPWHDPNLLIDIDSPEDYRKFLRIYPEDEEKG